MPAASQTTLDKVVAQVRQSTPSSGLATKIIAIDGGGGAGKSTLAKHLGAVLGDPAVVHVDDFIHGPNAPDVDVPRLLQQVIEPLAAGLPARYQIYDWDARRLGAWQNVPTGGLVILEGVSSIRPAFRPHLAFSIWIDTPEDERLRRGLARGSFSVGQWTIWQDMDRAYYHRDRPDQAADLILDGTVQYW